MKKIIQLFKDLPLTAKVIDGFLVIFILLLIGQMVIGLFFRRPASQEAQGIDIVMRATASSIFGYFLSANFLRNTKKTKKSKEHNHDKVLKGKEIESGTRELGEESCHNERIGFSTSVAEKDYIDIETGMKEIFHESKEEDNSNSSCNLTQVIIAACVGILSLIVIIIARNFTDMDQSTMAVVVQMRDFLSSSVGFLIGTPADGGSGGRGN